MYAPPHSFQDRVEFAINAFRRKATHTRNFSSCFEMSDGDAVVTAIVRRAKNAPKLQECITAYFRVPSFADIPWHETANKYADLSNDEVSHLSLKLQMRNYNKLPERVA